MLSTRQRLFGIFCSFAKLALRAAVFGAISLSTQTPAFSLPSEDAAYFCTVLFSGGISYDSFSKQWGSAKFRPSEKFVLKLRFLQEREEPPYVPSLPPTKYKDFQISLTEAGKNTSRPCHNTSNAKLPVSIDEYENAFCTSSLSGYRFNLKANRFLTWYAIGYVDGSDDNENTPSMGGGTCTKIN
ncbi:hypothetical protein HMPREF9695_01807 [Afipia broomeae ATCC 49717]|uniref:Uncharacterized protein n=1 Tax=Afipia broomeae ATCC 49717 TaxID=883078 RepID=K8PE75_9BRAD|nr:hypothetical protein HMPREF9695_01807 [Afipia broomeae ATCC 49717]